MALFDRLSITGECRTCEQTFRLELQGMEQKVAITNAGHWIKSGHFCPGPPELNGLDIPTEDQVANA